MTQTVLLVDDDANLLHGLTRVLRNQPCRLFTAHSAEEAIDILKAHPVDLIVSDEYMPGMPGTEFLSWVAQQLTEVVRIVLTGQPNVPSLVRAINEGQVFRFLTKPCNDVELALVIREGLDAKADSLVDGD